ncbi:DNA helicase-like protein [Pseudomonas sp. StFLB209]|nr:DNA helicase-like protein [Pseudomonas sp. StFLB209]
MGRHRGFGQGLAGQCGAAGVGFGDFTGGHIEGLEQLHLRIVTGEPGAGVAGRLSDNRKSEKRQAAEGKASNQ